MLKPIAQKSDVKGNTIELAERLILGNNLFAYHHHRVHWQYPVGVFIGRSCNRSVFTRVKSYIEEHLGAEYFFFTEEEQKTKIRFVCETSSNVLVEFTQVYLDYIYSLFPDKINEIVERRKFPIFKFQARHPAFGIAIYKKFNCNHLIASSTEFNTCDPKERTLSQFIFSLNIENRTRKEQFGIVLEEISHALFLVNDIKVSSAKESIFNSNYLGPMHEWSGADHFTIKFIASGGLKEVDNEEDLRMSLLKAFETTSVYE